MSKDSDDKQCESLSKSNSTDVKKSFNGNDDQNEKNKNKNKNKKESDNIKPLDEEDIAILTSYGTGKEKLIVNCFNAINRNSSFNY